jgi:recombination protein RecR
MTDKEKLAELFKKFPGIGPRQAKRMVYFLLSSSKDLAKDLSSLIGNIQNNISICKMCFRYFEKNNDKNSNGLCSICRNPHRNEETLMIVSRDVDSDAIEKSGVYKGMYFVLGGTIPFLSKKPEENLRIKELFQILPIRIEQGLKEIIFALSVTPEGENTTDILTSRIKEWIQKNGNNNKKENPDNNSFLEDISISKLGRGFSTGTEVEYSDKETLKNAISSRSLS